MGHPQTRITEPGFVEGHDVNDLLSYCLLPESGDERPGARCEASRGRGGGYPM